jgi:VIT1/CCC1 family predicted Fe2+/Mn2+ transporter
VKPIPVLSTLAAVGLVLVFGYAGEAAADVAVGPGPTYYTVQPQPAPGTAAQVAEELTAHDAFAAHVDAELNIDPEDLANPWQAAAASAASFITGALLALLAILLPPVAWRVPVTFVAVLVALGLAGALSARIGGSNVHRAVLRVVIGGAAGLAFTYGVGHLFGAALS